MAEAPAQAERSQEEQARGEAQEEEEYCRHCGQPREVLGSNPLSSHVANEGEPEDWLCAKCGRWQDSMICPTCKQMARLSAMPKDEQPKPHARARKAS